MAEFLEAQFASTAHRVDDEMMVTVPGFDGGQHLLGPVVWLPRVDDAGATVFPHRGDPVLVCEMASGAVWAVSWQPASL